MEWVGTLSRIAADNTRLDQWDQATGKLEEARQALYVLSQVIFTKDYLLLVLTSMLRSPIINCLM